MSKKIEDSRELCLSDLVERYLERLAVLNYAADTVYGRRSALGIFIQWCSTYKIERARELTTAVLREYLEYLSERPGRSGNPAPLTVRMRFSVIRSFCAYLAQKRLLLADPARGIEPVARDGRPSVPTLTRAEVERIMSVPEIETEEGLRDRSILEMLYSTGIRRAELSNLLIADAHLTARTVFVRRGKGGRDRMVPIGERACSWIEKYLAASRPFFTRLGDAGYLFLNKHGTGLSPGMLSRITGNCIRTAKINKKGACHIFRHTAATLMLEGGAEITHIQEFLGHESPDTTEIYAHVSPSRLQQEYRRTHPGAYREPIVEMGDLQTPHGRKTVMRLQENTRLKIATAELATDSANDALTELLAVFYLQLKKKKYAERTVRKHLKNSGGFLVWCRQQRINSSSGITADVMEDYQKHLTEISDYYGKPISPQQQYDISLSLRVFFRLLYSAGLILHNPMDAVTLPRTSRSLPADVLTAEEMEQVLAGPDVSRPYGLRDRAVMEILYATGIRRMELASLMIKDINFKQNLIYIRGENERTLPLPERTVFWIQEYLKKSRPQLAGEGTDGAANGWSGNAWLFLDSRGPVRSTLITSICMGHLRASGVLRGSVHIFRNTAAVLMLENGVDLRTLQEFLGHSNASSTRNYARLSIRKLREVHEKTHPGARLHTLED